MKIKVSELKVGTFVLIGKKWGADLYGTVKGLFPCTDTGRTVVDFGSFQKRWHNEKMVPVMALEDTK